MVRIRRRRSSASGTFNLTGGGAITAAGRGAHRKSFTLTGGGVIAGTGVKSIPSSGMPVGTEYAWILIARDATDTYSKRDDFIHHIDNVYGGPEAGIYGKLYTQSTATAGDLSWTNAAGIPMAIKNRHDAAVAAGNTALAARWAIPITFCFKTWNLPAFNSSMSGIPSWMPEVEYVYVQEVDRSGGGSGTPYPIQDYLNVYAQMEAARRIHVNGAKVYLNKNFTTFRQIDDPRIGFSALDYHGVGKTWTVGADQTGATPSVTGQNWPSVRITIDLYAPVNLLNGNGWYVDPVLYFKTNWNGTAGWKSWEDRLAQINTASGFTHEWAVSEWGSILPEKPPTGPYWLETELVAANYRGQDRYGDYPKGLKRTAWMQACYDVFESMGCHHAVWWCTNGTAGEPIKYYHLNIGHNQNAPQWINHDFPESIQLIKGWAGT